MARALARIDLGAVERNCARLKARAGRGRGALRGGQGRRLRPRRRRLRDAALAGGATRLAVATGAEAAQIGRRFPHVPLLTMGALTPEELDTALAAGSEVAVWREDFRDLVAARARAQGRPARVHVKHDSGMGRLGNRDPARCWRWSPRLRRGPGPRAGRRLDPLRDRRRTGLRLLRRAARSLRRGRRGGQGRVPARAAHAANSAAVFREPTRPLRHGPLRDRRLRARPLPARPGRARPEPAMSLLLLRRRRQALRRRRQRRIWADLEGAGGDLGRGPAARLRRRRAARPLQQRRGPDPRPPPSARRHRLDGQRHGRPRPRDRRRARRRGGADRRARATRRSSPRRSPRASARSTTRSPAGSRARVPRAAA